MDEASSRPNLYGMSLGRLHAALEPLDPAPFRARQAFGALYRRDALAPGSWTEFPESLRDAVGALFRVQRPTVSSRVLAADGTLKVTLALPEGGQVEAVAIRDSGRTTFCVSSQVGCAFGCSFCMTGRLGFRRHLDAGEIVGQVAALQEETGAERARVTIVFMGMGEPLHNFDAVLAAVELLTDQEGFGFGARRITISTVGIAHRIHEMAEQRTPVRLAVSLVAADQDLRAQLVPAARRWPLSELAEAIRAFGRGRRDRPTLEVVLLDGVNDTPDLAHKLAAYARQARAKVNLVEFNPTPDLPYRPAGEKRVQFFLRVLSQAGVVGTVRRSRGRDAYAACGQLAFIQQTGE